MFRNYLKIAFRALARNKTFSAINILGLALGLACSMMIILWVVDERSVDGFHTNGKYLYQLYEAQYSDGKAEASYLTQGLLADELKKKIPEIKYASGLEQVHPYTFQVGDKALKMDGSYAGEDFFQMFSYPLLRGIASSALNTPTGIAISRKMAEVFFSSPENAIGKNIRFENKEDLQVTAVFEDLPANSSQQFDFLRSWRAYVEQNTWVSNWGSSSPYTLVQLGESADPARVAAKIRGFVDLYKTEARGARTELLMQPFPEKYLHSTFKNGHIDGGRIEYVRIFSFIAVFILLIACINFMNLATASSAKRAKEVGIRKVIGAFRAALMGQFLGEALLLTFFAIIVAIALVLLMLPTFNGLTGKQLTLPVGQPVFWVGLLGLLALTGTVAGSYPALFLSSLNPIGVLKGNLKFSSGSIFLRKSLVVFQFTLAVMLIVGMIIIYQQVEYVQHKNLGYDRDNLLYLPIEGDLIKKYDVFKDEADKLPGVLAISKMKESPTVIAHTNGDISWPGKDPNQPAVFSDAVVGYDYVKTLRLQLASGRDFSRDFNDSVSFLVNEMAAQKMGYKDAVGQPLYWGSRHGKIIGVLKDFHFNSMHQNIEPLVIRLAEDQRWGTILIRVKNDNIKEVVSGLERIYRELNPNFSFTYAFADQEYNKLYKSEQLVSKLSGYFAFLAIFISSLGLFGLAIFTGEQRTKEIGIRKVLGSSVPRILFLLLSEFLKPIVLALLIAFPLAWFMMYRWLQDFAYRTAIDWWVFVLAAVITIVIALLTVSYQSIKAALMNPVKSIRTQ